MTQLNDAARAATPTEVDHTTVMVVDDDAEMREFLQTFLAERGYETVTLGTPSEAIVRYQTERPAAVILDMAFPGGMDGLDALTALKKIDHRDRSRAAADRRVAAQSRLSRDLLVTTSHAEQAKPAEQT